MIKIDREAVMKIAVNGDLFTLKKGLHELNLTVGGIPFKQDGLISKVRGAECEQRDRLATDCLEGCTFPLFVFGARTEI